MNGKAARAIRKVVYGKDNSPRSRTMALQTVRGNFTGALINKPGSLRAVCQMMKRETVKFGYFGKNWRKNLIPAEGRAITG